MVANRAENGSQPIHSALANQSKRSGFFGVDKFAHSLILDHKSCSQYLHPKELIKEA